MGKAHYDLDLVAIDRTEKLQHFPLTRKRKLLRYDVDNLFAEELRIGSEIKIHKAESLEELFMNSNLIQVKVYALPEYQGDNEPVVSVDVEPIEPAEEPVEEQIEEPVEEISEEPVEDLTEEVPQAIPTSDFVLTNFAETFGVEVPELEAAPAAENVILENNGIYTIADNLEYTNVVQDPDFKQLVNSIL